MALTVTITSYNFDKKVSEVAYYSRVLDIVKQELQRGQGTVTSGTIMGTPPPWRAGLRAWDRGRLLQPRPTRERFCGRFPADS